MPKWSNFIRDLGTAGPATVQGIYALGFALRSEIPALLLKVLRVDITQGFTDPEKLQGRTNLGLGTMSTQAANSVAIAGGSIAGITDLAVVDGGTGASNAATARTNLGLGNVDNTSDANKPVSTAQQTALNLKANLNAPTLADVTLNGVTTAEFLRNYYSGFVLANNSGNPNNGVDFALGATGSDGASSALISVATALTKLLSANWAAGTGVGGLDTGAKANNTWYYPWAIRNPTTLVTDILLSASATAPTLPGGFTQKKRLRGAVRTDGSGNIRPFLMIGAHVQWTTTGTLDQNGAGNTAGALYTVVVPPAYSVIADVNVATSGTAGNFGHRTYTPGVTPAVGTITAPLASFIADDSNGSTGGRDLVISVGGQIGVIISAANTLAIYTNGWTELI